MAPARAPAPRCATVEERLGGRRVFGIWTNLYALRGPRGLGVGNLTDLRELVRFAGAAGAAFVGVNPLHALRNRPPEVSPYGPVSRLFRNPLYLDVEVVPELDGCREARELLDAAGSRGELEALRRRFRRAARGQDGVRAREYADYRARQGELLRDFSTFCALEDHFAARGLARDWRVWPPAFRAARSAAVREFAEAHAEEVDFHAFAQFELDRQLALAAREARAAGLGVGLYQDLALGSAASGFDVWAFPELFADGASVGAPPDAYAPAGQDWGFPPLDPARLATGDFRYWRLLLRAGFAHAGALRIDHVLGLFRQFWIPRGETPADGQYVRYPARELLGILADESHRAGALAIGEDLGTVAPHVAPTLARFGVLSSRVLLFERDRRGAFRPAARYSRRALVTANTHDLPTLAGFWRERDLELLRELGALDADALADAREERARERRALLRRLAAEGALPSVEPPPSPAALCAAVHAFLCRTPAPLVGLSLDDLAGEVEPVNLPGVPVERFPSWTRRMGVSLEALARDPDARRALAGASERGARSP